MVLAIFWWFCLFFLPLFKNFGIKKDFGHFSNMQFLAKNLTIYIDSLWIFLPKMYTFVYFTWLVFKLQQKLFSTKCEGGTILKYYHQNEITQKVNESILCECVCTLRYAHSRVRCSECNCTKMIEYRSVTSSNFHFCISAFSWP